MNEVIDEEALFSQMSKDKGDRLTDIIGTADKDNSDDGEGAALEAAPAAAAESASAAPAADGTTTTTSQPAAAAPAAAAPAQDIWATAPAELKAAHEAALAQSDQRYRSDIGRQAAYQRRIQVLEGELAARTKPAAAADGSAAPAPSASPAPEPAAPAARTRLRDDPRIKKSLEDYPEVVEPLLAPLEALEARMDDIGRDATLSRAERAEQTTAAQEAALAAAHPDWKSACSKPEFADWLNRQPAAIKEIVKRNGETVVDAEEAIAMVSSFKASLPQTPPPPPPPTDDGTVHQPTNLQARRDAQMRAVTSTPKGGPAPIPGGPSAAAGDDALFNHFAAKKVKRG